MGLAATNRALVVLRMGDVAGWFAGDGESRIGVVSPA
jgi:hypothetical protein